MGTITYGCWQIGQFDFSFRRPSSEEILEYAKAYFHLFYFLLILLPYFYIEALFIRKETKSVRGEVVLITGTGHGIGKQLAIKYAREGATVVGWDVNEELNSQTVQYIKKLGYSKVYGYKVDVSNRTEVMETAQKVQETVGDVTILINNAGVMPHHSFLDHTEAEIRKIMDVNIMAHFWILQAFLPAMRKNNHGHVVALSSMAGLLGLINLAPYNASKFAVRGLMAGLHEEFRRYPSNNVHFTTIYPYMIDTGLCKTVEITYPVVVPMLKADDVAQKIYEAQIKNKKEVCLPADIGALVAIKTTFVPERAANYLTDHFKADLLSDLELRPDEQTNTK